MVTKVPMYAKKIFPIPLQHPHQQPESLILSKVDSYFHVFVTSNSIPTIQMDIADIEAHQTEQGFFSNLLLLNFCELLAKSNPDFLFLSDRSDTGRNLLLLQPTIFKIRPCAFRNALL